MQAAVLFLLSLVAAHSAEVVVDLPGGGSVALSTKGSSAFRVRFSLDSANFDPIDSPMVGPDEPDVEFSSTTGPRGSGIRSSIGSVLVSTSGVLSLMDSEGNLISETEPLGSSSDICQMRKADVGSCDRVAPPQRVDDQRECCNMCKKTDECTNWIFGDGSSEGNCWLIKNPRDVHPNANRILGGAGVGSGIEFSTSQSAVYGKGAGAGDALQLRASSNNPHVENRETYVPYYYSPDGYSALGVVAHTSGSGKHNYFAAAYSSDGVHVAWSFPENEAFELYLMPAASLDEGTKALYALTGRPKVPPKYAFGFTASRWGWKDEAYIKDVLNRFRTEKYPIDSFIVDFGWFTNISDYDLQPEGETWYNDFGWSPRTFPNPAAQLSDYATHLNVRMAGIRKPRLGNTALLTMARSRGWILPGGELLMNTTRHVNSTRPRYADHRNLDYGQEEVRTWYAQQQSHYIKEGVAYFWNDEGETDYFTFYWWNVAQLQTLRMLEATRRFWSLNRAFSPGMARLGAGVWTGDVNPSWEDLKKTPGMILNWGLAGAPYVACDIGGFTGQSENELLTRWYQVGAFMPIMRVHSTKDATPHFPWLWAQEYATAMRQALNLRYQLIPYHYSLAHTMYKDGSLWMRPLVAEFDDMDAMDMTTQWMDGDLMVAPVLQQGGQSHVYLPRLQSGRSWFAFNADTPQTYKGGQMLNGQVGLDEIPVYVRGGSIIALGPVVQYVDAMPGGPLMLHVYAGQDATFVLYEDDGETTDYETSKDVKETTFSWEDATRTLHWTSSGSLANSSTFYSQVQGMLYAEGAPAVAVSEVISFSREGQIRFK